MSRLYSLLTRCVVLGLLAAISVPAAQADAASLKKLLAERKAKQAPVELSPALTQSDVDKLLVAAPKLQALLAKQDLPEPTQEQKKKLAIAHMKGRGYSALGELIQGTAVSDQLDKESQQAGFDNYLSFADRADAVMKVFNSEEWILMARGMTRGDEPKPAPVDNLWLHIHDESVPAAEREKLSTQLDEMLAKSGGRREDAELVYSQLDTLRPVFKPGR